MMPIHRAIVYERIDEERDYQEKCRQECNWRPQDESHKPPECFLVYIDRYLERAKEAQLLSYAEAKPKVLAHIRKIAALAVACLELHGCPKRDMTDVARRPDWGGRAFKGEDE